MNGVGSVSGRGGRLAIRLGLVVLASGFLVYRVKFRSDPVLAHEMGLGVAVAEVMGTGTLEARVKTTISARIQERLVEVLVDQGDRVRAGQVLARLDEGELTRQVAVAEATLGTALATLGRVRAEETRAAAVERQARIEHDRISGLLESQVSARADFDKAVERLSVAEAEARRAVAAIAEAEAEIATAEKSVRFHKERLGFTKVTSPYGGLVVRRDLDPGVVVVPGASILGMISTNELWVSAWVDETAMSGLATGQAARVVFRSEADRPYPGEVARLGREVDRETREFVVDVRVKTLPHNWAVGQRAEVFIETGRREASLVMPSSFIAWRDGAEGAHVLRDGRVRWQAVRIGLRGPTSVEVAEGLSEGDVVCAPVQGRSSLRDGQRVSAR